MRDSQRWALAGSWANCSGGGAADMVKGRSIYRHREAGLIFGVVDRCVGGSGYYDVGFDRLDRPHDRIRNRKIQIRPAREDQLLRPAAFGQRTGDLPIAPGDENLHGFVSPSRSPP